MARSQKDYERVFSQRRRRGSKDAAPVEEERESLNDFPRALKDARCHCWERRLETGERVNPYVYGHDARCYLFIPNCPVCGMSSGTHLHSCTFWDKNPDQSPF